MEISAAVASSGFSKLLLLPRLAHGPPAVRADPYRSVRAPRALVRRRRRSLRKSIGAGGGEEGDDLFSGDGDDGPFGGGGGRGRGWNFGVDGGANWEEEGGSSSPDPAFDFVYELLLWFALSNCTHFAVKKLGRILEERGKTGSIRLVPSLC